MKSLFIVIILGISSNANDECFTKDGIEGRCKSFVDCPYLHSLVLHSPIITLSNLLEHFGGCGSRNEVTYLCCPIASDRVTYSVVSEPSPVSPLKGLSCCQEWILFEGSCYYFGTDKGTFFGSRLKCLDMGGDLVKITSDSEFYFLQKRLTGGTWVGFTDKDKEGVYRWISDDSIPDVQAHRNWWHGPQPDDYGGSEDFGHFMYRDGVILLNDVDGNLDMPYICEKMPTQTCA